MIDKKNIPQSFQKIINQVNEVYADDQDVQKLFENCFLNTYQTTLKQDDEGTFVITGDIPAMWLRDSSAQVRPYLVLAKEDQEVAGMLKQVIERQWKYILMDPYANAFNRTPSNQGHQNDRTDMSPWIWERKYEVDSLCYPIQLTYLYWKATGDRSVLNEELKRVLKTIHDVWKVEQNHEEQSPYLFERDDCRVSDTLLREGKGGYSVKTGMTWSGFRPSDDACLYGYLIPANMFAVVTLGYAEEMLSEMGETTLASQMAELAGEIKNGIETYGKIQHPVFGEMYVYETDGNGQVNLMDDANVPSLLSMPYLGYTALDDQTYRNTRNFILSRHNAYYYEGSSGDGIGSPHTPDHYIWHIALAIQGMTAASKEERAKILAMFKHTHGSTYFMHEGFNADRPEEYTRTWFAWANSMFSEFILSEIGLHVPGSPLSR
ncbi:glycoside hydrolase family 125 protein [Jeotgalibacillus proteolyticus]|uniref:Metal-independent alpha-mannosidase n=1 Tax=Jeotgalibacillus proteolyticus TaxID=2082395 RepID=A0A2S5GBP8_9BACL|nr:glycoside hydrolase family 125 protein [Jeotgalibacillus proteolyticus]PPA70467.1 metal-independent alpha-mannosidase [Jeotgalibacillus proteolyticus]